MAFRVEESFRIDAPPDRVWSYLVDPERVVDCLPGAELLEVVDEDEFRGRINVSVGPVKVAYRGTARFADVDPGARRVRIEARGEEASGPGSASMTMESTVTDVDGGAQVEVTADVEVAGKIVQFGRGMIETVSGQLFRQFTDCARSTLEASAAGAPTGGEETGAPGADPSAEARGEAAAATTDPSPEARTAASGRDGREDDSLNLVGLVLSALWEKLRGLFGGGR